MKKYFVDLKARQINKYDERFYEIYDAKKKKIVNVFPNITEILSAYPKQKWFYDWLKKMGMSADQVRNEAGEMGSQGHDLIKRLCAGDKVEFADKYGENTSLEAWEKFLQFCKWYVDVKPKLLFSEQIVFSLEDEWGGTLDAIWEIKGKICVYDYKFGNTPGGTFDLQTSAYAKGAVEMGLVKRVDEVHCLHISPNQYKTYGYKDILVEEDWGALYEDDFLRLKHIWQRANKGRKPKYLIYPNEISLMQLKKMKNTDDIIKQKYTFDKIQDTVKKITSGNIKTNRTKKKN